MSTRSTFVTLTAALTTLSLTATACEIKNPIQQNEATAKAPLAAASDTTATDAPAGAKSPEAKSKVKLPDYVKGNKKVALPNKTKLQMNEQVRKALQERAARAEAARKGQADGALGDKAAAPASKRGLKSSDFTKLTPDPADTAKTPPKAGDLKRYIKDLEGKGPLMATIVTTKGDFHCTLYEKEAPITVANFVGLARGLKAWQDPATREAMVGIPLYQDVIFHRVIPNFMIQGGDPLGKGLGGPGYRIKDEFHPELKHTTGALLSMANAGPNTGGSQFFITEVPTPHLDNRHAIFGKCEELDLVKQIARVPTKGMNRPKLEVKIKKIVISRGK